MVAPHRHVEMLPRDQPFLWDGAEAPTAPDFPSLMLGDHFVSLEIARGPDATVEGPPFVLRLAVYAPASPYDTLVIDSLHVTSSQGRQWVLVPEDSFPLRLAMRPDPLPPPVTVQTCKQRCTRQRAFFISEPVIAPDMRGGERVTVTAYLQMRSANGVRAGVIERVFRPRLARHLFAWIVV